MEKMKEIWIVWISGSDEEYYSSEDKAARRCVDIITKEKKKNIYEFVDCLQELIEDHSARGICGYYNQPLNPCYNDEEDCDKCDDDEIFWDGEGFETETEEVEEINEGLKKIEKPIERLYRDHDSPRDFYFHIYNRKGCNYPLTVNGRALEFDTFSSATRFLHSVEKNTDFDTSPAMIKKDCLYYDGLYIDATNCIINENGELTEIGEKQNG